jgi:hypothetical protein
MWFSVMIADAKAWLGELRALSESLDRQLAAARSIASGSDGGGGGDIFTDVGGIEDA